MMFRRLRIVASYLCFAMCVAFIACWPLNYGADFLPVVNIPGGGSIESIPWNGKLLLIWNDSSEWCDGTEWSLGYQLRDAFLEENARIANQLPLAIPKAWGFGIGADRECWIASAPFWFLTTISGALAILFKPKPRLQFSVRGLLILTTIVAFVFGGITALARS